MWTEIEKIEGFFSRSNLLIWQTLIDCQLSQKISGNFFEIGVWKGRSAAALTKLKNKEEKIVLLDFLIEEFAVLESLKKLGFDIDSVIAIGKKSSQLRKFDMAELEGTVRWFHIDGDHSAQSTYKDIALADRFLSEDGVIVLDDFFNPRYVSVAWAVFDYMRNAPHSLRMFLAGDNKAYLCRPALSQLYRGYIMEALPGRLKDYNMSMPTGQQLALHQSSSIADCDTLGLGNSFREGRNFLGFDTDTKMEVCDRVVSGIISL